jgi:hypothetical protein
MKVDTVDLSAAQRDFLIADACIGGFHASKVIVLG